MKRAVVAVLAVLTVLGLSGCNSGSAQTGSGDIYQNEIYKVYEIRLDDGRIIDCIYMATDYGQFSTGGPSCDWSNPK